MRIEKHPIREFPAKRTIHFFFDGKAMTGCEGDTIAAALHASGVMVFGNSIKLDRPRGFYCAIGNCGSCNMTVNGIPNIRTCITSLEEGMVVERQKGLGSLQ